MFYFIKLKNFEDAPNKNPEKIVELDAKIKESEAEREELNKQLEKLMDKVNEETRVSEIVFY